MQLSIDNVGILRQSTIDVNGLTVIVGANNSGKSTIGKTAYALIRAVDGYEIRAAFDRCNYAVSHLRDIPSVFPFAAKEAIKSVAKKLSDDEPIKAVFVDQRLLKRVEYLDIDEFINRLYDSLLSLEFEEVKKSGELFFDLFEESAYSVSEFERDKVKVLENVKQIVQQINKDADLKKYIKEAILTQLSVEFANQIAPAKRPDSLVSIDMTAEGKTCFRIQMQNGRYEDGNVFNWSPYDGVFYIDDPFVVEDDWQFSNQYSRLTTNESFLNSRKILSHRDDLRLRLKNFHQENMWEKVQTNENFKNISDCLDSVLPGAFISENESEYYKGVDGAKLNVSNLATGSKMFSILKMLLASGRVSNRTLLILDEPECHLHPEWQNRFAEIVVLLVKEIGCHVILTTHSQNFLLALDTYTRKYEIKNISNFYHAKKEEDGVVFECVNTNLKSLYADFLHAFSRMKRMYDALVSEEIVNDCAEC